MRCIKFLIEHIFLDRQFHRIEQTITQIEGETLFSEYLQKNWHNLVAIVEHIKIN